MFVCIGSKMIIILNVLVLKLFRVAEIIELQAFGKKSSGDRIEGGNESEDFKILNISMIK